MLGAASAIAAVFQGVAATGNSIEFGHLLNEQVAAGYPIATGLESAASLALAVAAAIAALAFFGPTQRRFDLLVLATITFAAGSLGNAAASVIEGGTYASQDAGTSLALGQFSAGANVLLFAVAGVAAAKGFRRRAREPECVNRYLGDAAISLAVGAAFGFASAILIFNWYSGYFVPGGVLAGWALAAADAAVFGLGAVVAANGLLSSANRQRRNEPWQQRREGWLAAAFGLFAAASLIGAIALVFLASVGHAAGAQEAQLWLKAVAYFGLVVAEGVAAVGLGRAAAIAGP